MATDGTPEFAAKRCGEAIARLRTLRGWSRAQLIIRLYNELPPEDPNYDSISETWLARLENGRMVKVQRQTVEALCRALRCSPQERAWVLLYADRNVLVDADCAPTPAAEALTFVMDRLYAEAGDLLTAMVEQTSRKRPGRTGALRGDRRRARISDRASPAGAGDGQRIRRRHAAVCVASHQNLIRAGG